jgi:hypothetical protein
MGQGLYDKVIAYAYSLLGASDCAVNSWQSIIWIVPSGRDYGHRCALIDSVHLSDLMSLIFRVLLINAVLVDP